MHLITWLNGYRRLHIELNVLEYDTRLKYTIFFCKLIYKYIKLYNASNVFLQNVFWKWFSCCIFCLFICFVISRNYLTTRLECYGVFSKELTNSINVYVLHNSLGGLFILEKTSAWNDLLQASSVTRNKWKEKGEFFNNFFFLCYNFRQIIIYL